jgi:hypothetical protein
MTPEIAQTLHGYAQGHRLLAHGGDIRESEFNELERLSDLSGYLPADASFTAYHTGFPCGRYFAFACTWPDHDAPRRGTVLTHTLLIPIECWIEHANPFGWSVLHRQPASADEREAYSAPLSGEPSSLEPSALSTAELRGLLALWFGQGERPVLWAGESPSLHVVRTLWSWLWVDLRRSFAFCTYALQVRTVQGRPFDLLMVPPTALGAFHDLEASGAWWLEGRLRRGEPESWVDAWLEEGPDIVFTLVEVCHVNGLTPPSAWMFRAAQRYWELAEGAGIRLAAARARVDMLARIWPNLPAEHEEVVKAVTQLVARQADAPLAPRPLWDLQNMLSQPYVRAQLDSETAIGGQILDCLREQVRDRLIRASETSSAGIVELYAVAPQSARGALREGLAAAARAADGVLGWGEALLEFAEVAPDEALGHVLWNKLPVGSLVNWLDHKFVSCSLAKRESLRSQATMFAVERGSPELARAAWAEQVGDGLHAAASVVEARADGLANFEALLVREAGNDQLDWCLDCRVERLRPLAVRIGGALLRQGKPSLAALAARCEGHPLGAPIFIDACPWGPDRELEAVLRRVEALALQIVHFSLADSTRSSSSLASAAARAVPGALLWTPQTRATLTAATNSQLDIIIARLLTELLAGGISAEEAGAWLAEPRINVWLQRASSWELQQPMSSRRPGALINLAAATGQAVRLRRQLEPCLPLGRLLQSVTREELAGGTQALLELLAEAESEFAGGLYLRAEVLGAVDRTRISDGWRLAEVAFHPVYRIVVSGAVIERVSWWTALSWDRAKHWRHWLLETWVERDWPAESLVRCLNRDLQLAGKLFKRAARRSRQTKAWLRSLRPALAHDPALLGLWEEFTERQHGR